MNFEERLRRLIPYPLMKGLDNKSALHFFDFSGSNKDLSSFDLNDKEEFESYIFGKMQESKADFGIGKYAEDRVLYKRFELFGTEDDRSFHLGLDIWKKEGTKIYAPLDSKVHSFNDNKSIGDYGPTIILAHFIENFSFYTLYGHLSRKSLDKLEIGKSIRKGDYFAELGDWEANVNWPPHLHFQIIRDMKGKKGDFPGVCKKKEMNEWMKNSPDPNLLLKLF